MRCPFVLLLERRGTSWSAVHLFDQSRYVCGCVWLRVCVCGCCGCCGRYSAGRTNGLVLDCGHEVSHIMAIHEGFAFPHTIGRLDLGGKDMTSNLADLLKERGMAGDAKSLFETAGLIKEKHGKFSLDYAQEALTLRLRPETVCPPLSRLHTHTRTHTNTTTATTTTTTTATTITTTITTTTPLSLSRALAPAQCSVR